MSGIEAKTFQEPDETVTFDHGHVDIVNAGSLVIGRQVLEPGWRWSTHVKPIVGTDWCEFHHVSFLLAGRIRVETAEGESHEVVAGEVVEIAPGHDAWVLGDEAAISIDFQGVVGWAKAPEPGERILTTVLFTDIVDSTVVAERLGDRAWKRLLSTHQQDVRGMLELHRGREVKTTGDGFLATFDAPARAITGALAIAGASRKLGIEIRAGVHTGEVEISDGDLGGVAVHLAARIMAAAGPGEVFVSATSRELASGAGVEFVDRGSRLFKGMSEQRQIYEVRSRTASPRGPGPG
jgi:class 3 adenylate cyclase